MRRPSITDYGCADAVLASGRSVQAAVPRITRADGVNRQAVARSLDGHHSRAAARFCEVAVCAASLLAVTRPIGLLGGAAPQAHRSALHALTSKLYAAALQTAGPTRRSAPRRRPSAPSQGSSTSGLHRHDRHQPGPLHAARFVPASTRRIRPGGLVQRHQRAAAGRADRRGDRPSRRWRLQ